MGFDLVFVVLVLLAAHEFYILISGTVKVHRHDSDLGEFALDNVLCTLGPFDCFGELVLRGDSPLRSLWWGCTDVVVVVFGR